MRCDRVQVCTSSAAAASGTSDCVVTVGEENCTIMFESANRAAWIAITEDPVLSAGLSVTSVELASVVNALLSKCDVLCYCENIVGAFRTVFVGKKFQTETDRDSLTSSVHQLRISPVVEMDFRRFVQNFVPNTSEIVCRQLLQIWLRKIVAEFLRIVSDLCTCDDTHCAPELLTDNDQEVLYHVCGYIVGKLTRSAPVYRKLKHLHDFITCLSTKELTESGHFVDKYKQWVNKQSRGGLSYPRPDVYLLVRELDSIYRQQLMFCGVSVGSVDKGVMRAEMLNSFMVKHYWARILRIGHADAAVAQPVLEYIISLFITIKGFSLAKKETSKFSEKGGKNSKSFRGKLKKTVP